MEHIISGINIDDMFKDMIPNDEKKNVKIYDYQDGWYYFGKSPKRKLDTVHLKSTVKNSIIEHIKDFKNNEQWYLDRGINYQTGILLYGPPGTGKTSLIKAIGSEFDKPIYRISSSKIGNLERAILNLPENAILVVEDIDGIARAYPYRILNYHEIVNDVISDSSLAVTYCPLTGSLMCTHGRILIFTTNHKEKLDPALLRKGRINLEVEIGYADKEVIEKFFESFYPDFELPEEFTIKEKLAPANVQQLVIENLENPDAVFKAVAA
jgi:chaperone BCS1